MVVDAIQSFVYCNCMCYICRLKTDIITHSIHLLIPDILYGNVGHVPLCLF